MKYKPKVGDDFPITTKEIVVAKTKQVTELTRSAIAVTVLVIGVGALAVAGLHGLYKDDFQILHTLWAVVAAPLGWIFCYYFRGERLDG